jgi:hypothetical protein
VFTPAAAPARAARYAQVKERMLEGGVQRGLVRLMGVARIALAKRAKSPNVAR